MQDPVVLLLAEGESQGALNHAKGHLFEQFMAQVLHVYGYEEPTREHLNVTANGVELDIRLRHDMDRATALAECKAYSAPVNVERLAAFYGKLSMERLKNPEIRGFFIAIPRLTGDAQEAADEITAADSSFRVLTANDIWSMLSARSLVKVPEASQGSASDPALVVHESGVYGACLEIDPATKTAARVLVRANDGGVHSRALELLGETSYAQGLQVLDTRGPAPELLPRPAASHSDPLVVEVVGSTSDFEYQLPASPKYFVGRRKALRDAETLLDRGVGLIVLNAQSGWGKSSLALKVAAQARARGGHSIVVDARTAGPGGFVPAVLRHAASSAEAAGLLRLHPDATWATLAGSLQSLRDAQWGAGDGRLLIFFDQFENVFKDEDLTREFRDLALWSLDRQTRLLIGFAWKTDYVGWTENHPYRLRDEIRGHSSLLALEPFGARDVEIILKRLEKQVDRKLSREIRQRLREYSQGLPWLLKKLSGHLIREMSEGKSQEQLVAEALNVANLFESDLASLNPAEREALTFVARYAPIQASEITERFNAELVQSLLDQRLIVQVGEKLDTYWDTFRDYLNTGRVPIEDSFILRQTPASVARLVSEVLKHQGDASVSDITSAWNTSENVVWNVARELRQLGLASYVPNRVQLIPEIMASGNMEAEFRKRVGQALRRHRGFSAFTELAERGQGEVAVSQFARTLKNVFPAVDVADSTWNVYARVFLAWFEYAGIASTRGATAVIAADGSPGKGSLITRTAGPRAAQAFPVQSPGPSIRALECIAGDQEPVPEPQSKQSRRAITQLIALGAVTVDPESGTLSVVDGLVRNDGRVDPAALKSLLSKVPGGADALRAIESDPSVAPLAVGQIIQKAYEVEWKSGTLLGVGKAFRAWARAAGVVTSRKRSSDDVTADDPFDGLDH